MDSSIPREALRPWMHISTRHTNQAADHERFYRVLKAAFEKLGPAMSFAI